MKLETCIVILWCQKLCSNDLLSHPPAGNKVDLILRVIHRESETGWVYFLINVILFFFFIVFAPINPVDQYNFKRKEMLFIVKSKSDFENCERQKSFYEWNKTNGQLRSQSFVDLTFSPSKGCIGRCNYNISYSIGLEF